MAKRVSSLRRSQGNDQSTGWKTADFADSAGLRYKYKYKCPFNRLKNCRFSWLCRFKIQMQREIQIQRKLPVNRLTSCGFCWLCAFKIQADQSCHLFCIMASVSRWPGEHAMTRLRFNLAPALYHCTKDLFREVHQIRLKTGLSGLIVTVQINCLYLLSDWVRNKLKWNGHFLVLLRNDKLTGF